MSKGKKSGVLLGVLLAAGSLTTMVFAEEEKVADSSFPLVAEEATCMGSNLAELTADAMQWYAAGNEPYEKADFSLVSEKVFAGSIPSGVITEADIRAAFREDALMIEVNCAGGRLLRVIDDSTLNLPAADDHFLTPGNLSYIIDPSQPGFPAGNRYDEDTARVLSVVLGKKSDIGWVQNYTVAMDSFTLEAFPDLNATGEAVKISAEDGIPIADVVIAYMRETMNGTVSEKYADAHGDGRFVVIAGADLTYDEDNDIYTYELHEDIPEDAENQLLAVPESMLTKKLRGVLDNPFYQRSFLARFTGDDSVAVCTETSHNVLVPVTEKAGTFVLSYGNAPGQKSNIGGVIFAISLLILVFVVVGLVSRQNVSALLADRKPKHRK